MQQLHGGESCLGLNWPRHSVFDGLSVESSSWAHIDYEVLVCSTDLRRGLMLPNEISSDVVTNKTQVALAIGNGAYSNAGVLSNPRNDARAVANMITHMGFNTYVAYDRDYISFRNDLRDFAAKAREADLA